MKNASYKPLPTKKLPKNDREQAVLLGLVELYLKTGKPVGSLTLQENGFKSLSSATIRNYLSRMEAQGYLRQPHTSGGRIPTEKAFRFYADTYRHQGIVENAQVELVENLFQEESREVTASLNRAAEAFSEMTKCAVFASTPRFDQDFVQDARLIQLDPTKLLSVLITDFGLIRTETIYLDHPVDASFLKDCEAYFLWRMNKGEKPSFPSESEAKMSQRIYNEVMVRHVISYANFCREDIIRAGLSKLLAHPEYSDTAVLAKSLSLLEDEAQMRSILHECCKRNELSVWIGDELCPFLPSESGCTIVAIPYRINQTVAGAIAILGPMRMPYRNLFGLAESFSKEMSRSLTESAYKYKLTFREPLSAAEPQLKHGNDFLLEDKSR